MASVAMCAIASRYFCSIIVDERRESVGFERSFFVGRSAWRQKEHTVRGARRTRVCVCVCDIMAALLRAAGNGLARRARDSASSFAVASQQVRHPHAIEPAPRPGLQLEISHLELSSRAFDPRRRPRHATDAHHLADPLAASSFDDNSADSPRNRPPAATTR